MDFGAGDALVLERLLDATNIMVPAIQTTSSKTIVNMV